MLGQIMKLAGAAKSVADIVTGKADSDDYENAIDVAGDLVTTFIPAAAPVVSVIESVAPSLINVLNKQEPGKGDKFKADLEHLQSVTAELAGRAEAISSAVRDMSDDEFNDYADSTGY